MSIGDPDMPIWSDRYAGRTIEMRLVVSGDPGLTDRHHDLALAGEFEDLVADSHRLAERGTSIPVRAPFRYPQVSLAVEREPMREGKEACSEAVDQISIEVELQDRVEVRPGTLVRTAPVQDPEVFTIRIGPHAADDA